MATRTTTFPDGKHIKAFRAVEAIFREDPELIKHGVKFRTWDGDRMDGTPVSSGQCPMLRMSPEPLPNKPITQAKSIARMGIKVELYVSGMMAEDIVNFWGAVEAAMVRLKAFRNTTVQCYIESECGSTRTTVVEPAYGSWKNLESPPDNGLAGVGRIEVDFLTNA